MSENLKAIINQAGTAVSRGGADSSAVAAVVLELAKHCEQLENRIEAVESELTRVRAAFRRTP